MDLDPLSLPPAVSEARLEADLRVLTGVDAADGPAFVSRNIQHPDCDRAGQWLASRFGDVGLEVSLEPFEAEGVAPYNVVAELPGTEDLPWVIVGAHYDSTVENTAGWDASVDPAPGAVDDASGVVALLEVARLLAAWEPGFEHPVRFVAFSAEEQGLYGSFEHVGRLAERGEAVEVAVSLDSIGDDPGDAGILFFTWDDRWPEL